MWSTLILVFGYTTVISTKKLTYYVDFEHPNITYCNRKYVPEASITAQRYSRRDPIHYVNVHFKTLIEFGNDIRQDVQVYEFLSNEYRRSMLELHFRGCELFYEPRFDFMKPFYMKYYNASLCPFKPGVYNYMNMTIPNLPLLATFPYRKGRAFFNTTHEPTGQKLLDGYIDAAIKHRFV